MHLPPLRDRRDDIPYLTARFVRECAERLRRPITGVTAAAERLLQLEPWPGNVRELRNVIERACILTENKILSERDLTSALATTRVQRRGASGVSAWRAAARSQRVLDRAARAHRAGAPAGRR